MTKIKSDNFKSISSKGTYALLYSCLSGSKKEIGRLGIIHFKPGRYIYIGSAFGPGGIGARINHRIKKDKTKHWHADLLTDFMKPKGFWHIYRQKLEHEWAGMLSENAGFSPVKGFGCSDCRCGSHLFFHAGSADIKDINLLKGIIIPENIIYSVLSSM